MDINQSEQKTKSNWISKHHMLLMILCCMIPIIAIVILRVIGVQSSFLSFAVVLVCPLSMVIMMVAMATQGKKDGGHIH